MKYILFLIALAAQAQINVGVLDQIGTSLPGTCSVGQRYTKTDATAAAVLYVCTATNTWTQQVGTGSSSIPDDGLRVSAASGAVRLSTGSRRIGSATYTLSALCDATPSAGTGLIFWYMTAAGVFTAGHNVTATITSGSCSISSGVTTYPQGSMGLGYCAVTSGVVGACTASPQTGRDSISAGAGITVTGDAPQQIGVDPTATLAVAGVNVGGSGAGSVGVCDSTNTYCLGPKGNNSRTTSLTMIVPTADPTANQFRVCTAASGGNCNESWLSMPLTTKGDLWVTDGTAMARLPIGTVGQVLQADPSVSTYGMKWAAASGGSSTVQRFYPAASGSEANARYMLDNNNSYSAACSTDATAHSTTGGRCWILANDSGTDNTTIIAKDQIPPDWVSGTVTAKLWFGGNNGGTTIQFKAEVACIGFGDDPVPASWSTPQNWASQATTGYNVYSKDLTLTMPGSCSAEKIMSVRIKRVDSTGYARVYGVSFKYALP